MSGSDQMDGNLPPPPQQQAWEAGGLGSWALPKIGFGRLQDFWFLG